jgi:crotonobetaine/carnitine-CoA ligase
VLIGSHGGRTAGGATGTNGGNVEREWVLPHLIARRAGETPERPAVQCVDGTEMTFHELSEQSLLWADAYRRLGVTADEHVATMLPHSFDSYLAWLGVAWLRAVEVPTNTGYRGEMLRYLLADSQARVLVIAEAFLDRLAAVADRLPELELVVVPDLTAAPPPLPFRVLTRADFLAGAAPAVDLEGPEYHDVSAVIYTSGTTGASKGVLVPWAGLHDLNGMLPDDIISGPDSGYYSVYPAYHVAGKAAMYAAYVHGARLVFRESFSLSNYWDDIRRYNCEFGGLVGPMVSMILAEPEQPDEASTPLQGVVMAPVVPAFEEFKRRFGVRVCTGFGMTEIGYPFASGWELTDHTTVGRLRTGPPGFEARVVNELDEDLGPNQLGELVVRTREPWVITSGYYNMPDKTAAAWRNGWFHTGDGFMRDDDGNWFFLDRVKDALRRRGENISSFEVEVAINEHPAVLESAAIGVPSELSEDEVKIVIVLRPGEELDPADLIAFLVPRMPRFMIPRFVEFVAELPKTPATRRVQKYELRQNARNENTWDREAAGIALPK